MAAFESFLRGLPGISSGIARDIRLRDERRRKKDIREEDLQLHRERQLQQARIKLFPELKEQEQADILQEVLGITRQQQPQEQNFRQQLLSGDLPQDEEEQKMLGELLREEAQTKQLESVFSRLGIKGGPAAGLGKEGVIPGIPRSQESIQREALSKQRGGLIEEQTVTEKRRQEAEQALTRKRDRVETSVAKSKTPKSKTEKLDAHRKGLADELGALKTSEKLGAPREEIIERVKAIQEEITATNKNLAILRGVRKPQGPKEQLFFVRNMPLKRQDLSTIVDLVERGLLPENEAVNLMVKFDLK